MDLVSIALIAIIAVVLLLQVIAIVQIAGMRKSIRELKEIKAAPSPAPSADRFERKGGDFRRHEKRPFHAERPSRPPMHTPAPAAAPAPAVDPVETSLRDINLRLKNAERDQEYARKKIQENLGDRDQHYRGHDRGDRGNDRYRNGQDRNRDRDGGDRNRGGRDRNRNPRRDNWQDRNRQVPPQAQQQPQQSAAPVVPGAGGEPVPMFERKEYIAPPAATPALELAAPSSAVAPQAVAPTASQTPDQAPADFSGNDNGFEHGRKVFVKRRPLRDESGEGPETPVQAKEEASFEPSAEAETTEIQFGRRKGL